MGNATGNKNDVPQENTVGNRSDTAIDKRAVLKRLLRVRGEILKKYPFYGQLLMRLQIGLAKCETAYTDAKNLVFDPVFVNRLSDTELIFLMNHEVLHCALGHCTRGKTLHQELFNIACDIVINSILMQEMNLQNFTVDGEEPMHLTPKHDEGRKYNAEQVYEMFLKKMKPSDGEGNDGEGVPGMGTGKGSSGMDAGKNDEDNKNKGQFGKTIDNHDKWNQIEDKDREKAVWDHNIKDAAVGAGSGNVEVPSHLRKIYEDLMYKSKLNWREILQDFIQLCYDSYDYTFMPPDNRFCNSDFALPAFCEDPTEVAKNIWFVVDTSASVDKKMLSEIFAEIKQAIYQFPSLSGFLSCFDTSITVPEPFDSVEDIKNINPVGGGGTSFYIIFRMLADIVNENIFCDMKEKPAAIIIMTDGYADFPSEEATLGIPVLWMIKGSKIEPSFGKTVYLD